ncbi:MAG: helix-turn-helix transcriptional regulator [Beijerinckiaceae bacterium]
MRKATRLFEIIQMLRTAVGPVTAARMAQALGVTERSIYRDVAALQAMRVPVEGGRGIGYMMRRGFELPPLMFSVEEMEAIVLALGLLQRAGDPEMKRAAERVRSKVSSAVPPPLRQLLDAPQLFAWGTETPDYPAVDIGLVRRSIRDELKLALAYRDEAGRETNRMIWPIALIYYAATINIVAWCELRRDIRRFRADRILAATGSQEGFSGEGDRLRREWVSSWEPG